MTATRILASLMLILVFAATANAGVVDYYWDSCVSGVTDKSPGVLGDESQFVSLSDHQIPAGEAIWGHGIVIAIGPNVSDRWRYDAPAGCMAQSLAEIRVNKDGIAGCFGLAFLEGTAVPVVDYAYDNLSQKVTYTLEIAYPTQGGKTPCPDTNCLTTPALMFGLTYEVNGKAFPGPPDCPDPDAPLCFHLTRASITQGQTSTSAVALQQPIRQGWVTWQDPNNQLLCPGATPSETSTWGRLKGLYR